MSGQETSSLIRDYVTSIYHQKGKILFYNVVILVLTLLAILFWPREYRSSAKIWIKLGRENSRLDPTVATGETISIQETDREDEIKSIVDIMGSRGVIEGAVERLEPEVVLGKKPLPGAKETSESGEFVKSLKATMGSAIAQLRKIDPISDRERAVREVTKHMVVEAERKSNVVSITYNTDSPELAQAVVENLIVEYKDTHSEIHTTSGARNFFKEQLKTLKKRAEESSEELRLAQDQLGLASIDGHRQMLEGQLSNIGASRLDTTRRLAESSANIEELTRQLSKQAATVKSSERSVPNTGRDLIREQLYALQVQRMELEANLKSNNPRVLAIREQEDNARRSLASQTTADRMEVTRSLNTIYRDLSFKLAEEKARRSGFQAMLKSLNTQEVEVGNRIAELNQSTIEMKRLERDVELAVNNYMGYAENLEDARVDEELNAKLFSNISIAQAPTLEERPISPSKVVVLALGLAAMLFGSIAIAAATLLLGNKMTKQQDVENTIDVPFVVSVPNDRQYRHVLS